MHTVYTFINGRRYTASGRTYGEAIAKLQTIRKDLERAKDNIKHRDPNRRRALQASEERREAQSPERGR